MATSNFAQVNNINLHYLDSNSDKPMLLLMHGLTANAHAFDGLIADGLADNFWVICPDLRGNGLSDKPAFGYTVEEHVQDILGLISHLGEKKVYIGGHSFGGYLAFYMAANYPHAVGKLVIMDAAKSMNPKAVEMLSKAISRLDITYPTFDKYLEHIKKAPYLTFWDDEMLGYYRADVEDLPNGHVKPRSNIMTITEKSMAIAGIPWEAVITQIGQHTILINALDVYTMGEPLLPDMIAKETVEMMKHAEYAGVDGNHQTMLYGDGAKQVTAHIKDFLAA
jgi:pimeloyl-ACP methyl ester carboxylesterase